MEIKFKQGERVRFEPRLGTYDRFERTRNGEYAIICDESDIPTIEFTAGKRSHNDAPRTAALQEDLVRA